MVRTAFGIKVSSGKSGKKGGGGGGSSGSFSFKGGSSSSTNRLPSIPHTEVPAWQKPITNFFTNKIESNVTCEEKKNETQHENDPDDTNPIQDNNGDTSEDYKEKSIVDTDEVTQNQKDEAEPDVKKAKTGS